MAMRSCSLDVAGLRHPIGVPTAFYQEQVEESVGSNGNRFVDRGVIRITSWPHIPTKVSFEYDEPRADEPREFVTYGPRGFVT